MIGRVYEASRRHRARILAAAGVGLLLVGAGAFRLDVRQDVASLVTQSDAGADRAIRAAADTLAAFGTLDTLMVELSKRGADRAELERGADQLVAALEASGHFVGVHFRVGAAERRELFEVVFPRRFHLFAAPKDYGPGVDAARRDLMSPAQAAMEPLIYRDPAAHRDALLDRLRAAGPGMAADTSAGTLLSEDGQHALVLAEPAARALDIDAAQAAIDVASRAAPAGFEVRILGAHVFATASAASIKRDVRLTIGLTLVGVLLFFAVVFRRVGAVWPLLAPVGAGGLFAVGVTGWLGSPVHGITLGFGAVMVGIAVDYGTHLVVHLRARRAAIPGEACPDATAAVYRETAPGVAMAAVTTLVAVGAMALSENAALSAFARFAGLGIGAAFVVALFVLPPWLGAGVGAQGPGRWALVFERRGAVLVLGAAALLTVWLAPALADVRFDGDIRNLDYQPPALRTLERAFADRYRHPRHPTLVVASGVHTEEALQRAERVAAILERAKARGEVGGYASLATLVPSKRTQKANLRSWTRAQRAPLERATRAAGMRLRAFDPFFAELQRARRGEIPPLVPPDLMDTPLARLAGRLLVTDETGARVLTVAHLSGTAATSLPGELRDALGAIPGVELVSAAGVASAAVIALKSSVARLAVISFGLVALLLAVFYRRLTPVLAALLPVCLAIVWTWGAMARFDVPLNLVSIGAFGLVCGLGVDYGVFVTTAAMRGAAPAARTSVFLAACTTLLGFAALLTAKSPVMWSLGFAVVTGVGAAFTVAVLVLPALWTLLGHPTGAPEPPAVALQLAAVLALGLGVGLSWLTGAQVANGWQVATALALDAAVAAWLVYRIRQ